MSDHYTETKIRLEKLRHEVLELEQILILLIGIRSRQVFESKNV